MKKFIAIAIVAASLVACGGSGDKKEGADTAKVAAPDTAAVVAPAIDTTVKAAIDTAVKAAIDTAKAKM